MHGACAIFDLLFALANALDIASTASGNLVAVMRGNLADKREALKSESMISCNSFSSELVDSAQQLCEPELFNI